MPAPLVQGRLAAEVVGSTTQAPHESIRSWSFALADQHGLRGQHTGHCPSFGGESPPPPASGLASFLGHGRRWTTCVPVPVTRPGHKQERLQRLGWGGGPREARVRGGSDGHPYRPPWPGRCTGRALRILSRFTLE